MAPAGWQSFRTGGSGFPSWLTALEPLTTGLLAQDSLKLWCRGQAALGIRSSSVVYPVFPGPWDPQGEPGARQILGRLPDQWCVMGPSAWVDRAETLLPPSRITHRVLYDFLVRPGALAPVPLGPGELRTAREAGGEPLFALQEAYEKEEVLFDPAEFQPVASRLHFWKIVREQEIAVLWLGTRPVAKAGTNALTPGWAQLGGVYTLPEQRRQGLQKRLLSFLLDRLATQGRGACLFVKKDNGAAGGLYRSLGFEKAADFTILYGERQAWAEEPPSGRGPAG